MVLIRLKKDLVDQFLFETTVSVSNKDLTRVIVDIYNGRLKVERICGEIEQLIDYGPIMPPEMIGLNDEQIRELKLVDVYFNENNTEIVKDPSGRRNGCRPNSNMCNLLKSSITKAQSMISKKLIPQNKTITMKTVQEAIELLRGTITVAYPMKLPSNDPIRLELENCEDLSGTQASLEVFDPEISQLWFAGKQLCPTKTLADYIGRNEKTKIILKLGKRGYGPPAREPAISEEEQKELMLHAYKKLEEEKRVKGQEYFQDHYLNCQWADNQALKKSCHSLNNIDWKPR